MAGMYESVMAHHPSFQARYLSHNSIRKVGFAIFNLLLALFHLDMITSIYNEVSMVVLVAVMVVLLQGPRTHSYGTLDLGIYV